AGILRMAISDFGSTPTTLAVYSRRSVRRTVTSLAPLTTCALVMMPPSGWMMNPEPSPRIGCGFGIWNGRPRKNGANGLLGPKGPLSLGLSLFSSEFSSPWEFQDVDTLLTTLMLTTAGPYLCTMVLKSGSMSGPETAGAAVAGLAAAALVVAAPVVAAPVVAALVVAALVVAALVVAAVVATARVAPARYSAPAGTAMVTAPRAAAMSGFLMRFDSFM